MQQGLTTVAKVSKGGEAYSKVKNERGLTPRQAAFVDEYVKTGNGRQSAIAAGYSNNRAEVEAGRLLTNAAIKELIDLKRAEKSKRAGIDAAWLLKRLAEEAEAKISDLYNKETGQLLPVHEWPEIWQKGLVAGVEVQELFEGFGKDRTWIGNLVKIKVSDRVRRLELIGKHIGVNAFQENVKVSGLGDLASRLDRAIQRSSGNDDGEDGE